MKESAKTSLIVLWLLYAHLLPPTESSSGGCQSRESTSPIAKNVGENVQLLCLDNSPCHGTSHAFYHYNRDTEQSKLIQQGSYMLTININTLDDAGEYYCIKECARNATPADQQHRCYWNITVPPVLKWNINENVTMNQSINGSCTATGSPRPLIEVIISRYCEYQTELTALDDYTTAGEFRILHVSRYCQDIYCHISNHQGRTFSKQLNIKATTEQNNILTSIPSVTTVSTNLPTYTTGTSEQGPRLEDDTSTDTDINMIQTRDSQQIMLILIMVMLSILTIAVVVLILVVVWINMRRQKSLTTKA